MKSNRILDVTEEAIINLLLYLNIHDIVNYIMNIQSFNT